MAATCETDLVLRAKDKVYIHTVSLAERPKSAPACLLVYWDGTEDAHASAFGLDPLDQWLNNTRALFNCLCKLLKMKSFHV